MFLLGRLCDARSWVYSMRLRRSSANFREIYPTHRGPSSIADGVRSVEKSPSYYEGIEIGPNIAYGAALVDATERLPKSAGTFIHAIEGRRGAGSEKASGMCRIAMTATAK